MRGFYNRRGAVALFCDQKSRQQEKCARYQQSAHRVPSTLVSQPRITAAVREKFAMWNRKTEQKGHMPIVTCQEFPSKGRCTMIQSVKSTNTAHLMSGGELKLFLLLEHNASVREIRTQCPLDLDLSMAIATKLNIRHARKDSGEAAIMSTDILVEVQEGTTSRWIAYAFKPNNILEHPKSELDARKRDLLIIEREYWRAQGVEWHFVCADDLLVHATRLENLHFFREFVALPWLTSAQAEDFCAHFARAQQDYPDASTQQIIDLAAHESGLNDVEGLEAFKHLAWHRRLAIDLNAPVLLHLPLTMDD